MIFFFVIDNNCDLSAEDKINAQKYVQKGLQFIKKNAFILNKFRHKILIDK